MFQSVVDYSNNRDSFSVRGNLMKSFSRHDKNYNELSDYDELNIQAVSKTTE